jgi:hypothetical protein
MSVFRKLSLTAAATALAVLGALAGLAAPVAAQQTPQSYGEYRVDAIGGRGNSVQGGAGLTLPQGVYVRLALDAAAGVTWRDGEAHASGRGDAIARFTLDPLRESRLGLSLGGGVSVPVVEGDRVRPYATLVLDLEGRRHGRWTPAVQLGLGGGVRLGLALRDSPPQWR